MSSKKIYTGMAILAILAIIISYTTLISVHIIRTESDADTLYTELQERKGTLVVEISKSVIINTETGEGRTVVGGYYIHHTENKHENGKEVTSVFVYNPANNATDDILWRFDI